MNKAKEERIRLLGQQIADLEEELYTIEKWGDSVRSLDSFSDHEKLEIFDQLYRRANVYLRTFVETGYEPKDGDYHLYEAVISKMLGSEVWDIINSITQ